MKTIPVSTATVVVVRSAFLFIFLALVGIERAQAQPEYEAAPGRVQASSDLQLKLLDALVCQKRAIVALRYGFSFVQMDSTESVIAAALVAERGGTPTPYQEDVLRGYRSTILAFERLMEGGRPAVIVRSGDQIGFAFRAEFEQGTNLGWLQKMRLAFTGVDVVDHIGIEARVPKGAFVAHEKFDGNNSGAIQDNAVRLTEEELAALPVRTHFQVGKGAFNAGSDDVAFVACNDSGYVMSVVEGIDTLPILASLVPVYENASVLAAAIRYK